MLKLIRFALILPLVLFFLVAEQSFACSLAPDYFDYEVGGENVAIGNAFAQSHVVAFGQFKQSKTQNKLEFISEKLFKPSENLSYSQSRIVTYDNVTLEKVYFLQGENNKQFNQTSELLEYLNLLQSVFSPEKSRETKYSWGGFLSDIHHGADCERSVVIYDAQKYLIFLDSKNQIQASFPVKDISSIKINELDEYFQRLSFSEQLK